MILVGRTYPSLSTTWNEHDETFEEVCARIAERRKDQKTNSYPDEIVEVVVTRRAVVRSEVEVEEVLVE